jgi:hypothetical protein
VTQLDSDSLDDPPPLEDGGPLRGDNRPAVEMSSTHAFHCGLVQALGEGSASWTAVGTRTSNVAIFDDIMREV